MNELLHPRTYQQEIVQTCKEKNCLIILPTGVGKTFIALLLAADRFEAFPGKKIIFLAPTRPLVDQHYNYFQKYFPDKNAKIAFFTGKIPALERKIQWQASQIIFSTPQCIAHDREKELYSFQNISLLIEDEAHRCLKNYSYTTIASQCKKESPSIRIIGLTASPGSTKEKIKEICEHLAIESIELRTRESEDVKGYLQKLETSLIRVDFPEQWEEIRQPLKQIYQRTIDELKMHQMLFGSANKITLIQLQKKLMASLKRGNYHGSVFQGISLCATALKIQHALELLETQTLEGVYLYFKKIFEESEKKKSKSAQKLVKQREFDSAYKKINEYYLLKQEHPKLHELKQRLQEIHKKNSSQKTIVFTQFRDTAMQICAMLNKLPNIRAQLFIGQAKRKSKGMSQKEQQQTIQKFSLGEINVLCATCIGEEGLDIPEVNEVIFYEPIPSEIRKIQRAGRTARKIPGSLTMLITRKTRDEAYHYAAFHKEKRMKAHIQELQEEFQEKELKEKMQTQLQEFHEKI